MAVAWWQPEFPLFEGHESVFNMGKVAPQLGELGTAWQQHEPKMLADVLAAAVRPCGRAAVLAVQCRRPRCIGRGCRVTRSSRINRAC
jgi:hypothetical protein